MNFTTRASLAAALLAAFGSAVGFLATGAGDPAATPTARWESAAQCRPCHADVFTEWQGSHHQIAFTNPEVRALSDDFRKEECMDCHLPRPLAVTGFGKRTLPRRTHFDEGVSCISCHLGEGGSILARNDRPEVPCRPRRNEAFFAVDACASCHNQHQTTDQWRNSRYAQLGTGCSACHMPEVQRVRADQSTRLGRGHGFPGAHDQAMLQQAATFAVTRAGDEVVLALTNGGAGHNFPTEERHRAVDMVYRFVGKDGPAATWTLAHRARQPYRDESSPVGPGAKTGEDTQLTAGKAKAVRLAIPAGAFAVEARLWYRLTPWCGDDSPLSTLLEERRLDLP